MAGFCVPLVLALIAFGYISLILYSGLDVVFNPMINRSELLIFHPERYHGNGIDSNFFEGWYFKAVTPEGESFIVIPGNFYGNTSTSKENHAFIMVLHGDEMDTFRFPNQEFKVIEHQGDKFHVEIGGVNHFSDTGVDLRLSPKEGDDAKRSFIVKLKFTSHHYWPITLFAPGVMGWYSYVPIMECYHGVVSMNHNVNGFFQVQSTPETSSIVKTDITNGKGYLEKDWGFNFPSSWIWFHSNDFVESETSLFISVAAVPWRGYKFPGFLVGFLYKGTLHRFCSWNGASFKIEQQPTTIKFTISNGIQKLIVVADRTSKQKIAVYGPRNGRMEKFVKEGITSEADISFYENEKLVFGPTHVKHVGLEVMGDIDWIQSQL